MNIRYTNEVKANGIKSLVYGRSGAGKTTLSATAPRPFIFSCESGLMSLRKTKVAYADVSTYKELMEGFKWATSSSETKQFDTFCLDSVSEIAEVVLAEEMKKTKDPRNAYGEMQRSMGELVRAFRDIPGKNVNFIAKESSIVMPTIPVTYRSIPSMPSKSLAESTPYYYDLVLHLYVAKSGTIEYRALHTQLNNHWEAKDRSGNLEPIEEPNLTKVFNKANGRA